MTRRPIAFSATVGLAALRAVRRPGRRIIPERRIGMVAMVLAMALLPIGDTVSKLLTDIASPVEITMWRMLAQAAILAPLAMLMPRRLHGSMASPVVALSGVLIVVTLTCLISAFAMMPIATAIAIFFVEPLVLTVLAGPLLGELAGPRRYAAVAVGLVGAMIVIRPTFAEFGPTALLPLLAAVTYALNMIVMRHATRTRSVLTIQLGATLYGAALLVGVMALGQVTGLHTLALPGGPGWVWSAVAAAGVLAAAAFLLIAEAFRRAEASILAPFQYLEIVGATIMGLLVFGDFPDALTWLGTAIILGSGAYVFHREQQADAQSADREHV